MAELEKKECLDKMAELEEEVHIQSSLPKRAPQNRGFLCIQIIGICPICVFTIVFKPVHRQWSIQ